MTDRQFIEVRGARENNLKDISLNIPKQKVTVFTGISGSGKSSLVFDTIAAEAQRQLNETFTAFVQGFLPHYGQPEVDHIGGWGGSMGAVTMIRATARHPEIEALVADSPFVTLEDELDLRIPYPLLNPLIRFFAERETGLRLDMVRPVDEIGLISPRPVFLIQGMGDKMVPLDSAERLYNAAGEPRELWTEADVPHMNMYAYYRTRYTKRVIKFFDTYLLGR